MAAALDEDLDMKARRMFHFNLPSRIGPWVGPFESRGLGHSSREGCWHITLAQCTSWQGGSYLHSGAATCLAISSARHFISSLQEQARAQALAERQRHKREAKEWLEDQVPRLAGK